MELMRFLGRRTELQALESLWSRDAAQLCMVYGRRRIGKSYLLERFSFDKPTIFYQATQQAQAIELARFSDMARAFVELPDEVAFPTWDSALTAVSNHARERKLVIILDEFPYLCESTPGLPSIIQQWWDKKGRRSGVMLILCGSAQTFMNELANNAAPLHGRFTATISVAPLTYREAAEFTPNLRADEKAQVYGILGGTPMYLDAWDEAVSLSKNIHRLFGDALSPLIDAPDRMLTTTLSDAKSAYRILQAISYGKTRWSEITDFAKVHDRAITQLVDIGLVERKVPVTEDPLRSRRGRYRIADSSLRFWFRFIAQSRGRIERGLGNAVIREALSLLDDHMGGVYEDIAREFAYDLVRGDRLLADDVGFWQSPDGLHEIDIVGALRRVPSFLGSVKWRKSELDLRVVANLEMHAQALGAGPDIPRLFIGRNGVDSRVSELPNVMGFSAEDLYAPVEDLCW